ncbi:hypothetical protein EQF93_02655 [Helcococcus ovis]|uniref:hypothetical protein n=1 Tax=Helcococcus ovis TaxID=72026 RepID=UPI00106FAF46|nr:hypothetical protein [Helcococcus ovis]TFF68356.1 hypothetical protein EQF93_02655 [Helcococcus ovis]WNZ00889.1 hypothetical protein EQF90_006385 [Helcococcus ovis]
MPNKIENAKKYIPTLDKIYKLGSLTSILDGNPELAKEGANAGELLVAKIKVDDMADYDKAKGYTDGDVTLEWETIKADYDRGRMFTVDNVENKDSADLAFGQLANEFIRTKVTPEIDAWRFSKYAKTENIGNTHGNLSDGANVIKALRAATTAMDEKEVPAEGRILFITPTLKGLIDDLDTNKSRAVIDKFAKVVEVPVSRFDAGITLKKDGGIENKNSNPLNFMIVHPSAIIQYPKHVAPKIVTPEANQNADAWKFGYRLVGVCQVYENKVDGIYVHATKELNKEVKKKEKNFEM